MSNKMQTEDDGKTIQEVHELAERLLAALNPDGAPAGQELLYENLSGTAFFIMGRLERATSWDDFEIEASVVADLDVIREQRPDLADLADELGDYISAGVTDDEAPLVEFEKARRETEHRVIEQVQEAVAADKPLRALLSLEATSDWKAVAGGGFLRFIAERGVCQEVVRGYEVFWDLARGSQRARGRAEMERLEAVARSQLSGTLTTP
jgi:hypothetical protein